MIGAFSSVIAKSARTATARSTNKAIAGYDANVSTVSG
jgi:hypothetical protein